MPESNHRQYYRDNSAVNVAVVGRDSSSSSSSSSGRLTRNSANWLGQP